MDLLIHGDGGVVEGGDHPKLGVGVESAVSVGSAVRSAADRGMGTVDGAADGLQLLLRAVNHRIHVRHGCAEPIHGALREIAVLGYAMTHFGVGDLQEDCAARAGKEDTLRTNVSKSTNHLNTLAP